MVKAGGFSMTVPADWTVLPLDPRTRDRRIARLVERQVGKDDRLAYVRRKCIADLRRTAADASARGAFFAALHTGAIKGMPLAASAMAILTQAVDASGNELSDPDVIAAHLARGGGEDDKGEVLDHSVVQLGVGRAARIRRRTGSGIEALDGREVLAETLHYYVPLQEAGKTLGLLFATPLLSASDSYVHLFDTMAASSRWIPKRAPVPEPKRASVPEPERTLAPEHETL